GRSRRSCATRSSSTATCSRPWTRATAPCAWWAPASDSPTARRRSTARPQRSASTPPRSSPRPATLPPTSSDSAATRSSELQILVGRDERVAGDRRRLRHPRPHAGQGGLFHDGREHHALVHELLDLVEHRLAPLRIDLAGLVAEER